MPPPRRFRSLRSLRTPWCRTRKKRLQPVATILTLSRSNCRAFWKRSIRCCKTAVSSAKRTTLLSSKVRPHQRHSRDRQQHHDDALIAVVGKPAVDESAEPRAADCGRKRHQRIKTDLPRQHSRHGMCNQRQREDYQVEKLNDSAALLFAPAADISPD